MQKMFGKQEEIDMEEFLNNLDVEEEITYEDADAFVKPLVLTEQSDVESIMSEVKAGNVVLLNIEDIGKRNALKLKECVNSLKAGVESVDGDIARISHDRIILTPHRVKIIKKSIME